MKIGEGEEKVGWYKRKYHLVSFTEEALPYIVETSEMSKGSKTNTVKLYTYKLDKIGGIQEILSMNVAEVTVTYRKSDKTPFYDILETEQDRL